MMDPLDEREGYAIGEALTWVAVLAAVLVVGFALVLGVSGAFGAMPTCTRGGVAHLFTSCTVLP